MANQYDEQTTPSFHEGSRHSVEINLSPPQFGLNPSSSGVFRIVNDFQDLAAAEDSSDATIVVQFTHVAARRRTQLGLSISLPLFAPSR